jgi:hypothetical protein
MPRWAGEAELVPVLLLRAALPGVTVRASIPDKVPQYLPLVVVRRTSGSSLAPKFWDGPSVNVQCWSDAADGLDPVRAASALADQCRRALWQAWDDQTVTELGHIVHLRESQAPMEVIDPDLPQLGRFSATYALRVRNAA